MMSGSDERAGRLVAMFQELLRSMPPGTASVERRRTRNDDGTIVRLKPSNPGAAEFSVHLDDNHPALFDVSFGSGTTFELPSQAKLPSDASFEVSLDVVGRLASAIIAGQCEERFGFKGTRGTIRVDATDVYRCTHFFPPT